MKKLIGLLVLSLFICSAIVFADKENIGNGYGIEKEDKLVGIENAIVRGNKSEEVIQHLTELLTRIEDKRLDIIEKLEDIKVEKEDNENFKIEGKKEGKLFGLFKIKHKVRFEITEDGTVKEKGWFKWIIAD